MKKIVLPFLIFLLAFIRSVTAQQDPQYSQYMFNQLTFNPAYAGSTENKISSSLFYHRQWLGYDYAPQSQNFIIHSPFNHRRNGIGFQIIKSSSSFSTNTEAVLSYSYRIIFAKGILALGINGGITHYAPNFSMSDVEQEGDVTVARYAQTLIVPELGTGLYYRNNTFYVGISAQHLISRNAKIERFHYPVRQLNWYVNAGYKFNISDNFQIITSGLFKHTPGFSPQFDLTNHFVINNAFWAGFSLRTNTILALQAGVRVDKIITRLRQEVKIGYAFDLFANIGRPSHEIMLMIGWEVHKSPQNIRKQKIQLSPFFL